MQEWKASEKEAQKMTRDGAISVNLVTGEATHVSDRPPEQDYSSADETAGVLNRAADEAAGHVERHQAKKARRKRRDTFREGEAARDRPSSRLQFSEADRAAEAFDGFMSLAHYQANRRTKSGEAPCDIRPFVVGGSIASGEWGYDISLRTLQTAAGALKPSLWLQCLREYAQAGEGKALLYRCAILSRQSDGTFVAMEDLAHAL